ncbi:MAG: glycosyltransferase family 4 protein [Pontixanthobacter sp.]
MATIAPHHRLSSRVAQSRPGVFDFIRPSQPSEAPLHIALIGNYPPQRCGLATFTADTRQALDQHESAPRVDTYILRDDDDCVYADDITHLMRRGDRSAYRKAARRIMASGADRVLVQHEFGIYGGDDGAYLCDLIEAVDVPVAVTLHTILKEPSAGQAEVMRRIIAASDVLIVMAEYGRAVLQSHYGVPEGMIAVIPHGIPDFDYQTPDAAKPALALEGRQVILTFGLLSPDKGIDRMVEAMPSIVRENPDALYIVLGATHPNLKAREGETLRTALQERAQDLGMQDHIRWIDAFVETDELIAYLRAADVYVTPYLNPMQITSGTLSYAVGMGKPVVSTPYIHASELLTEGNGIIVPFQDEAALAQVIGGLLRDDYRRNAMARTAYARGRRMVWDRCADALLERIRVIQDTQMAAGNTTAARMA